MTTKAGKRPVRPTSAREKLSAIRRVGGGSSKAAVARELGVPESTLRGWCKNEDKIYLSAEQEEKNEIDKVAEPKPKKIKTGQGSPSHVSPAAQQPCNLITRASPTYPTKNDTPVYKRKSSPSYPTGNNTPVYNRKSKSRSVTPTDGLNSGLLKKVEVTNRAYSTPDNKKNNDAINIARMMTAEAMSQATAASITYEQQQSIMALFQQQFMLGHFQNNNKMQPIKIDVNPANTINLQTQLPSSNINTYEKHSAPKAALQLSPTVEGTCLKPQNQPIAVSMPQNYNYLNGLGTSVSRRSAGSSPTNNIFPSSTSPSGGASFATNLPITPEMLECYRLHLQLQQLNQPAIFPTNHVSTSTISPKGSNNKNILMQHLTRDRDEVYAGKQLPPVVEQEYAEDLSMHSHERRGNSLSCGSNDSRSTNPSPTNTTESSLSIPSPTCNLLHATPSSLPNSPQSSSDASDIVSSTIQNQVTSIFNGNDKLSCNGSLKTMNERARNRKALKPKIQINNLFEKLGVPVDPPAGREAGDVPPLTDWRTAVEHGERFLSWLESGSEPSVTQVQVSQFRNILSKVKTNWESKEILK